jgi:uncharacterized protein YoaH (UPF0181 family)
MSTIHWFKCKHSIPDDIRIRSFTPAQKWGWFSILCLASQSKIRGVVNNDEEDISAYLGFSTDEWLIFKEKLIAKGLVLVNPDGSLFIVDWEEEQQRPSSAKERVNERVKKHRESKKKAGATRNADETRCNAECNADETRCNATDKSRVEEIRVEEIREEEIHSDLYSHIPDPESESVTAREEFVTGKLEQGVTLSPTLTPVQQTEQRFRGQDFLPPWKIGTGPNDWSEPVLTLVSGWMNSMRRGRGQPQATRADAIAYISKRSHPEAEGHQALIERINELMSQGSTEQTVSTARQQWKEEKAKRRQANANLR